ncbi:dTMP kinase [Halococcoides cellulosivorans]|uniref:dTMP kinase n=1 Tax=Halococcoides cellulosivorans TaxID=1679096 RepID=A0A2R4WXX8_9EURY|nr:hypothetical protein [Halococcoides cellulosivorans]AWB26399.1 hypothetical protein HARCEL1_01010 [Halococcoides cellulosivorans]
MSRRRDATIGLTLLAGPLAVIGGAIGLGALGREILGALLAVGGLGGLVAVVPISYKLLRYPSTRRLSLGDLVGITRREAGVGPVGTGGALICFSGIDGSGKTTQAERLVAEFEAAGVDATHVWARWRPFLSYPFMGVLYVTLGWRRKDYHRSAVLRRIWGYFLLIDHLLFFARYIYPHLRSGRVVCIDRYVLDQCVELHYDGLYRERPATLIDSWLPTPDVTFLMDVPAEVAADRKDDTGEMLDRLHIDADPIDYLRDRRELFQECANEQTRVIDTTRPIDQTHERIRDTVWAAYLEG